MARIRTIKPEFFTSEDIVSMTPLARLFYVSLWCEADKEGRFEWKPGTFKIRYLGGDSCDVSELAAELIERGLVEIYSVNGKSFAHIPTFKEHQVINNRESESTIPAKPLYDTLTRESGVQAEGRKEGKEGKEGKGKERKEGVDTPDGVSDSVWQDFKKLRTSKKSPITKTAMDGINREVLKAGITLEAALAMCCERGWTGFKAEWLQNKMQNKTFGQQNHAIAISPAVDAAAMTREALQKRDHGVKTMPPDIREQLNQITRRMTV
jgi:hypothetical protein